MYFPDDFAGLTALSGRVHRAVRWWHTVIGRQTVDGRPGDLTGVLPGREPARPGATSQSHVGALFPLDPE
jgi:hypothetical protein